MKKVLSRFLLVSSTLTSTSHNSLSETLDHILSCHNESHGLSESFCQLKIWSIVAESELWHAEATIAKTERNLDARFLLATTEMSCDEWQKCFATAETFCNGRNGVMRCWKSGQPWLQHLITQFHSESLRITPNHSESLRITPNHSESLRITPNHSESLRITPNHSKSLQITQNHQKWSFEML